MVLLRKNVVVSSSNKKFLIARFFRHIVIILVSPKLMILMNEFFNVPLTFKIEFISTSSSEEEKIHLMARKRLFNYVR